MNALPNFIALPFAWTILLTGIALIAIHTLLVGLSSRRVRAAIGTALFLAAWFALAIVCAATAPGVSNASLQPLALAVSFGPLLIAVALLFGSKTLGAINAGMPAAWPIRIQAYRILGFAFLYPLLFYRAVPAGFALPAGIGDMITGALALVVRPDNRRSAVAWNLFGILDLIVAPAAAVLTGADALRMGPVALIALFIGPPLGILTHVWSLRNLGLQRSATTDSERRSLSGRRPSPHPEGSALS